MTSSSASVSAGRGGPGGNADVTLAGMGGQQYVVALLCLTHTYCSSRAATARSVLVLLRARLHQRGARLHHRHAVGHGLFHLELDERAGGGDVPARAFAATCWPRRRRSSCRRAFGTSRWSCARRCSSARWCARHLPVQILDGELIVGSHFSTALSRCLKKDEARDARSGRAGVPQGVA